MSIVCLTAELIVSDRTSAERSDYQTSINVGLLVWF